MPEIKKDIENHLRLKKRFHIFHIYANVKQGKTVFLRRLLRELMESRRKQEIDAQLRFLRDDQEFSSGHEWETFILTTQKYADTIKKNLVLFLDDPLSRLSPKAKNDLSLFNIDKLLKTLNAAFKKYSNMTIIIASIFSGPYQDLSEEIGITHIPLHLTITDMKNIVFRHAELRRWDRKDAESFLEQPGIFGKCGRNLLFLLYLFEEYHYRPRPLRCVLDEKGSQCLGRYKELPDAGKRMIRFSAFTHFLGLQVPRKMLYNLDAPMYEIGLDPFSEPFVCYIILREEIEDYRAHHTDISEYFFDFLDPCFDSLCLSLKAEDEQFSQEASELLRNLLHFIEEERYRPLLVFHGHRIFKSLFDRHKNDILRFVHDRLLPKIEARPQLTEHIRRWASTLAKLGQFKEAEDLYEKILRLLPGLEVNTRVKVMIPLAKGLASSQSRELRTKAIEIYRDLLFNPEYARSAISKREILTSATSFLVRARQPDTAEEWLGKLRESVEWDALLWLEEGMVKETSHTSMELEAADLCYRKAIEQSKPMISLKPRTCFNALHRYAIFLTRHHDSIPSDGDRPSIESLLEDARKIAEVLDESVEAVYQARGEFFEKTKKDYTKALEEYRKAVEWVQDKGVPNPRPYIKVSNFLCENAIELSKVSSHGPAEYLTESEGFLRTITQSEDFDIHSRRICFNILGRLVGGTRKEAKKAYPYRFEQAQRPNYDEAIGYLENSFESDENNRFDTRLKTWQDILTHAIVKDILVKKAAETPNLQDKCACLEEAQKHFKATFEGLPREENGLHTRQIKENVITATDAYADFVWERLGKEGCLGESESYKEAEDCYTQAIEKIEEWKLNSASFTKAYEIYAHYATFLWETKVPKREIPPKIKVPEIPLKEYAKKTLMKIVTYNERALQVLSPKQDAYKAKFERTTVIILFVLRTLVRDAWHHGNTRETQQWVEKYSEAAGQMLRKSKEVDIKITNAVEEIQRFLKDRELRSFWKNDSHLEKKIERLIQLY